MFKHGRFRIHRTDLFNINLDEWRNVQTKDGTDKMDWKVVGHFSCFLNALRAMMQLLAEEAADVAELKYIIKSFDVNSWLNLKEM